MDRTTFFQNTPILAMLHLAGRNPVKRALDELELFAKEGVDGVIVENYHGNYSSVLHTLQSIPLDIRGKMKIGINILPNDWQSAFNLAERNSADFIQLDYVAGRYNQVPQGLNVGEYLDLREEREKVLVLGGVWPKYYTPVQGSNLERDIREGMKRADAIVVTGEGTGMETPLDKIRKFREILGDYPLVIGAGLTPENAYEQLLIGDAAIVGSCLKYDNDTQKSVDETRVRSFMDAVRAVREKKQSSVIFS